MCGSSEAVTQRCSVKKLFLEISQNSQEHICAKAQVFPCEFCEICKNTFFCTAPVAASGSFKDTLKAFNDFKNKQKSVWSNDFWYGKVCIFWNCIQYTIYWNKTQMLKKILFGQVKWFKKRPFFSSSSSNLSVLNCDSYIS